MPITLLKWHYRSSLVSFFHPTVICLFWCQVAHPILKSSWMTISGQNANPCHPFWNWPCLPWIPWIYDCGLCFDNFYSTNYFYYVCGIIIGLVFELTKVHKYLGGIGIVHVNPLVSVYIHSWKRRPSSAAWASSFYGLQPISVRDYLKISWT